jgi:hypothetical protein
MIVKKGLKSILILLLLLTFWSGNTDAGTDPVRRKATLNGLIRFSSPVLADLDKDGYEEILVGTTTGYLVALKYDGDNFGEILWQTQLGASIGSSPAVGDVNGDGFLEVVIGVGYNPMSEPGVIVLLDHQGEVQWRKVTEDRNAGPDGVPDGVFATSALGDLNKDGRLEIVVAAYDENLYVLNHRCEDLLGWPFHMRDNTWGSAALADLDDDGYLDVIVGGYRHEDGCPDAGCGRLFVFDRDGNPLRGWPRDIPTHLDSSPAVGDIDNDGNLEIVIGSGQNPDPRFHRVYAFEKNGSYVDGWPAATGGEVFSSPSLADVTGDGFLEVFVGARDGKLYGWRHDGTALPNWPVTPLNQNGDSQPIHASSPVILDADGDGQLDIFTASGWDIVGFKRDGSSMGASYRFHADYELAATPVFGDPDGDGYLDVIIGSSDYRDSANGTVYLWELPQQIDPNLMQWPMWRRNPLRNGRAALYAAAVVRPDSVYIFQDANSIEDKYITVLLQNTGEGILSYEITDLPTGAELQGTCCSTFAEEIEVTVKLSASYIQSMPHGHNDLGHLGIAFTVEGQEEPFDLIAIPVKLYIGDVYSQFLPLVQR